MEQGLAKKLIELLVGQGVELDESIRWVQQEASPEEAKRYKEAVATLLTTSLVEILNPLWREHPTLVPEGIATVPKGNPECAIHGKVGLGGQGDENQ